MFVRVTGSNIARARFTVITEQTAKYGNTATQTLQTETYQSKMEPKMNTNESSNVPSTSAVLAPFDPVKAVLAELTRRHAGVVHDVKTTAGMKAARKDRAELRGVRTDVEALRVKLKEPILRDGRDIDAEAKRITAEISTLELDYDKQIRAEDLRKEREAKEEADRKAAEAKAIRDAELAEERRIAAEREAVLQAERDAAQQRENELREQLAAAQAAIEAAKPVPSIVDILSDDKLSQPEPAPNAIAELASTDEGAIPAGWERIEAGDEVAVKQAPIGYTRPAASRYMPLGASVAKVESVSPRRFEDDLLDLLDVQTAKAIDHAVNRPVTASQLPDAETVYANLSDAAKRRTSPRNVADVLEAIRWIRDGR